MQSQQKKHTQRHTKAMKMHYRSRSRLRFPQRVSVRLFSVFLCMAFIIGMLSGCTAEQKENLSINGFAFDTTYTITLYRGGDQKLLDSYVEKCSAYEKIFSRTLDGSELYQVNEIEKCYEKE